MFMLLTTVKLSNKKNGRGYPPFPYVMFCQESSLSERSYGISAMLHTACLQLAYYSETAFDNSHTQYSNLSIYRLMMICTSTVIFIVETPDSLK